MLNIEWENNRQKYCEGWHTWNNDSVLSYIKPLEGIGIRLCVKDYKNAAFLENVLIGEDDADVIPRYHAYDDSYTELDVVWQENHFKVQSARDGDDLCILVSTTDERIKPSSLIVQGLSLYNIGSIISKKDNVLLCNDIQVYITKNDNGELYVPLNTPYISVELLGEIGISTGVERSLSEIKNTIETNRSTYEKGISSYGNNSEAYRAMQTCQAWDTIYDPVLKSPITTVSRIWNKQWGGYVLFCWDTYFGALMQSIDNKVLAYSNIFAITGMTTKEGFVPNYACQNGFKSFDRSQPPVGSFVCLKIYNRFKEKWFLEEVYEKLMGWNDWYYLNRQTKNGLLTWGSDPYEKYYDHRLESDGIGDWQGASYESGLDNSPMYENIPFDYDNHIFMLDDVGLSGLFIADCYALAEISEILRYTDNKYRFLERAYEMESKLEDLWDEETGLYLNRRTDNGEFEKHLSPFHFHVLFSKKVTDKRRKRMIEEHLLNPEEFWTNYPLPSIAKSDPEYINQTYWQGRVWAPMNYLVFEALNSSGETKVAEMLANKSKELILKEWLECGHVHENYDPENGEGCNSERSDKFYHWGGLLAYISLSLYDGFGYK